MSLAVRLNLAEALAIPTKDVAKHLLKPVGSTFNAGEAVAKARRGLRNAVVAAPVAGVLIELEAETGVASLVPLHAAEVPALVPGDVEYVDGRRAVLIRSVGHRVLGIVGLGSHARGPIRLGVAAPDQELQPGKVTPDMRGAIVVGGAFAGAAALAKLADVGAAAVVTGGLVDREVASFLGWQAEDRLAPWRPQVGSKVIGEGSPTRLVLMATEGFGRLPINLPAWELMTECQGRQAVVLATTRVSPPLTRPELIVPDEAALDEDARTSEAALVPGATVRLVDQGSLGHVGTIAREARRDRAADGQIVDVVEVELAAGGTKTVPISAVEVLL
jgi:hypothetical protein